jgi:uncharacterized protein (DUF2062 family)
MRTKKSVARSVISELFIAALPLLGLTFVGIVMAIILIAWVVTK